MLHASHRPNGPKHHAHARFLYEPSWLALCQHGLSPCPAVLRSLQESHNLSLVEYELVCIDTADAPAPEADGAAQAEAPSNGD